MPPRLFAISLLPLIVTGCADQFLRTADADIIGIRLPVGKPGQENQSTDTIDIAALVVAQIDNPKLCGLNPPIAASHRSDELNHAFAALYRCATSSELTAKRDRIQTRIMGEADRRCENYKNVIYAMQSNPDFISGSLAVLLGLGGALSTSQTGARVLSGGAGAASGINAEYQKAYFQQMVVSVIATGIDLKRQDIANELGGKREQDALTYTVESAVADAIRYAGACSLVEGTKKVKDRIAEAGVLGVQQIEEAFDRQRILSAKAYLAGKTSEPRDPAEAKSPTEKS